MSAHDVPAALAYVGGTLAVVVVLADYIRLRRNEYTDARAAKAQALLVRSAGESPTLCTDVDYLQKCHAFRSALCSDGRCRNHCREHCKCKGNQ